MTPKNEHISSLDTSLVIVGKFEKERLSSCDVGGMNRFIKKKYKCRSIYRLVGIGTFCVELHAANAVRSQECQWSHFRSRLPEIQTFFYT